MLDEIKAKYAIVLPERKIGEENGITNWLVPAFSRQGSSLVKHWIYFYTDSAGRAYWAKDGPHGQITARIPSPEEKLPEAELALAPTEKKFPWIWLVIIGLALVFLISPETSE